MLNRNEFVRMVDHTLLKPEATADQIRAVCAEGRDLHTASVCVNSYWVAAVRRELEGSDVLTCSVVGFPLGAMMVSSVSAEAADAVGAGAEEIDMVIPVGLVKSGDFERASEYVVAVRKAVADSTLKVILETALLTDDEIREACRLSVDAGADFVKTSTGFNVAGGATEHAVRLMRSVVGPNIGVKASGGIRSLADVEKLVEAGASRLGMSSTVAVAHEIG